MYSLSVLFCLYFMGTSVLAIGTQLRCHFRDGCLIDVWLRTKPSHLHQAQETLCGLASALLSGLPPAAFWLPFIFHCGTAPYCSVPMLTKICWSQNILLLFFTMRQRGSPSRPGKLPCLTPGVRASSVSTASLLPSLVFHTA